MHCRMRWWSEAAHSLDRKAGQEWWRAMPRNGRRGEVQHAGVRKGLRTHRMDEVVCVLQGLRRRHEEAHEVCETQARGHWEVCRCMVDPALAIRRMQHTQMPSQNDVQEEDG